MAQMNLIVTPAFKAAGVEEVAEEIQEERLKALREMRGIIKGPFDWRVEKAWIYEGMDDL